MRLGPIVASVAALLATQVGVAAAQESKAPVTASMILSIVAAPVDIRKSAYDAGLKEPAPAARSDETGEVLADGSVRYGRAVITVRNPCPPGEHLDFPAPRPSRR